MPLDHIILYRNPSNGRVGAMMEDDDNIMIYPNRDAAIEVSLTHPLCQAWDHQIVELDEL